MRSIARIFKLLGAKLLAVGSFYQSNPTRFRRHKRAAKILLIKTIPVVVLALVSLIIAQIFFKDMPIPPAIQFALLGFWTIVLAIRLYPKISPFIIVGAAAALLAAGIVFTPPVKVTVAFFSVLFIALIARRIEFGVLALLIMTSSIMHDSVIPKPFTFGGMGFGASELLLLAMLSIVLFIMGAERRFDELKSPMVLPMLLFCFAVVVSIAISYSNSGGRAWDFKASYIAARPLFLYLLFFAIAFGIRTERQLKTIIFGGMVIASIVSLLIVVQYFLGTNAKIFFGTPWADIRVEALGEESNVIRSMPPGQALINLMFPATLCLSMVGSRKLRLFCIIASFALGIGLVFGFSRSAWVTTIFSLSMLWILSGRQLKMRLTIISVTAVVIAVIGSIALGTMAPGSAGSKFSSGMTKRFVSIFSRSTLRDAGIQARIDENRDTLAQIRRNPVFGIGVGRPIRYSMWVNPINGQQGFYPSYAIHNSYLELWLIYGLLGVISFAWLSITFLIRSLLLYIRTQNPLRKMLALSFFAGYIAYMLSAIAAMMFLHQLYYIVCTALMWGCVEAMWRMEDQEQSNDCLSIASIEHKSPQISIYEGIA